MKIHRKTLVLTLTMATIWAAETRKPIVTLRLVNEARVDPNTLSQAQYEASSILRRSGEDLVFLSCEVDPATKVSPCSRADGPTVFWFDLAVRKPVPSKDEMLGFTEVDSNSGYRHGGVSYPAVLKVEGAMSVPAFKLLGAAIAHEVGHLILGASAHSAYGVMAQRWSEREYALIRSSMLMFTSEQSKRMQNAIRAAAER
jgi:hypothetical protein